MSAKWGIPAAVLAAGAMFGGQPPSFPPPAPGGPSIDFTVPRQPSGGPSALQPSTPSTPDQPTKSAAPRPRPVLPQSINVALKVERDGRLTIAETVVVRARSTMTRRAPLRIKAGDERDRVFAVRDVTVDGNASTELTGDEFVIRAGEGATTVTYTVDGAVINLDDHQEVRWQVASGWDVDVRFLRASFIAPEQPDAVTCLAGALGSDSKCESALTDHGQVLRVIQQNLKAGNRVDLSVSLPRDSVPVNARFDATSTKASAFALTPFSGIGLGVLLLLLLGGFGLLWLARGRDAKALATDIGPVDVLMTEGGRVSFASPDGVLPGQVGTVVDERADPRDVAATVVDLAVRNYLWIVEASGTSADGPEIEGEPLDWRIVRRNPADDALTGYERAVYAALLPDGTDSVLVSELRVDLAAVREAMYADVVARSWFSHRPDRERGRWSLIGVVLAALGVAVTVVLALTVGNALLGVALVIGGIALALGARWMPARTRRGGVLVQQVRGLLDYLHTAEPDSIPPADREMVFSRSLPYAVVLGQLEHWLTAFAALDSAADGTPGLYWYGTAEGEDLQRFATNFPAFLAALDRVLGGP